MAGEWAKECTSENGQPAGVHNGKYDTIGQNMHAANWTFKPLNAIGDWFSQRGNYDSQKGECKPGTQCSHYTQLTWAETKEIGCGFATCKNVNGLPTLHDATILVCNYFPAGNWIGEKAYVGGRSCTKCESGHGWCTQSLCTDSCVGVDCACKAFCQNCGELDMGGCNCKCADGWTGSDCTEECKDRSPYCGSIQAGWTADNCDEDHQYVVDMCPQMCGLCNPAPVGGPLCNWTMTEIPVPTKPPTTTPYFPDHWKIPDFWESTEYEPYIYVFAGVFGAASLVVILGCIWCHTCKKAAKRKAEKKESVA